MSNNPHYNNIFNKKNIEFQLDGQNKTLPYIAKEEVSLKDNQIIFSSINNVFQKFLDNDLYNEALLKKYIEYGYIGCPTYVSSIDQIVNDATINKKFVVSGENGISVLRKEEIPVADTLSGRFLDGTKVNKIEFINERYVACTQNGIYESLDKENWTRVVGEDGHDVKDICYNYNFLIGNCVSAYNYIAAVNVGLSTQFYGHNGTDNSWKDFSTDEILSNMFIDGINAERVYTFENDPLFYVGTKNHGLLASNLSNLADGFTKEMGTDSWSAYDMTIIPNVDEYEKYLLATNYGIKQSQKTYGFKNLKNKFSAITYVFDVARDSRDDAFYVATGEGLFYLRNKEVTEIKSLHGIQCFSLAYDFPNLYVGTEKGLYRVSNGSATLVGFENQSVSEVLYVNECIVVRVNSGNKVFYSRTFTIWDTPNINLSNETVKQLKEHDGTVYIVTDKNIYALVNGNSIKVFSWKESVANENNVYFAQNVTNSDVLLQIENDICLLNTIDGSTTFRISNVEELENGKRISSAIKHKDTSYYAIIDSTLYNIYKNIANAWTLSAVEVDGSNIFAKKIASFSDPYCNGIAFINGADKVRFLRLNVNPPRIESLSKFSGHKDVSTIDSSIYSINSNQVVRYNVESTFVLSNIQDIPSNDGVEMKQYVGEFGYIENKTRLQNGFAYGFDNDSYLSVFADRADLEINYYGDPDITADNNIVNVSIGFPTTAFADLDVKCADFIGYANNTSSDKTILVGTNNGLLVYDFPISMDVQSLPTAYVDIDYLNFVEDPYYVKTALNKDVNTIADICYRREIDGTRNGSILCAANFVGTNDGLYAISAEPMFVAEHSFPYKVNCVVKPNVNYYAATSQGIYVFDTTDQFDFNSIGYIGSYINDITFTDDRILASKQEEELLLSSHKTIGQQLDDWEPVWNNADDFTNFIYESDTEGNPSILVGTHNITSDYGTLISASLSTISDGGINSDESSILINPIFLSSNSIDVLRIEKLYKDTNGVVKIEDSDGNVYSLALANNYATTKKFTANLLQDASKELSTILELKLANFYEVSGNNLKIGLNDLISDDLETESEIVFSIGDTEPIVNQDTIEFNNLISTEILIDSKTISNRAEYENFKLSGGDTELSGSVDFNSSNGIQSFKINASVEISGHFIHNEISSFISELSDDDGQPIIANEETIITDPLDPEIQITINPGEYLSDFFIDVVQTPEDINYNLLSSYSIDHTNNTFVFESKEFSQMLSSENSVYELSSGTDLDYKAKLKISDVSYTNAEDTNGKIVMSYDLSSDFEYTANIYKLIFPLQETIDDLYYDNVYYGSDNVGSSNPRTNIHAFCVKYSNDVWLMFDGINFYAFDGFKARTKETEVGIVQLAKTYKTDTFNDLYYFYPNTEELPYYRIRKTNITEHDKNFDIAKDQTSSGQITKISLENNTVYAIKENKLYYTTSGVFPNFNLVAGINGDVVDVASCKNYTYVLVERENQIDHVIYRCKNAVVQGTANESTIGSICNFFIENGTDIYCKTINGIWYAPYNTSNTISFIKVSDFTNETEVRASFTNDEFYHGPIVITDYTLYGKEMLYDFENGEYRKIVGSYINEKIVDLKAVGASTSTPHILAATTNKIYDIAFSNIEENLNCSVNSINFDFESIKAIYFSNENESAPLLYVIDDTDLYVFELNIGTTISIGTHNLYRSFLDDGTDKISINDFRNLLPGLVLTDSINAIGIDSRFIEQPIQAAGISDKTLNGFVVNTQPRNKNAYLYDSSDLYVLSASGDNYGLNALYASSESVFSNINWINKKSNGEYSLWSFNGHKAKEQTIANDGNLTSALYSVETNPNLESIFYYGNNPMLATSKNGNLSKAGIYGIKEMANLVEDEDDEVHKEAERINNKEIFKLEFFGKDYIFNYVSNKLSLFKSNNSVVQDFLNGQYVSGIGATVLSYLFNRYLLISDGDKNYVYDIRNKKGHEILFTQLETINGSSGYTNFIGMRGNIGAIGYENSFFTFDGFSNIRGFGNVNPKYVALLNNFKRGSKIIKVLNDVPDFLIGTTFGLKYVYNDLMTRSFYDRENDTQITRTINAIDKVLLADNDEYFVVGEENSLFEVTNLYSTKFKKLYDFDEDEQILDIFVIQKNEYVIATTKGIWLTSLKFNLINELSRFTIDNIYEIINDELKKIIEDHIASDHKDSSIITKVNKKANNKLSFVFTEDKHVEKYNSSVANGVKIVENDIIDTIVRGGEDPNTDSYVKVGISNWALNTMDTESTYTDPGFYNSFVDPTSGKKFDISIVPYIVKNWKSGLKEIYIYVPTTGTYYANNPQGISNSQYSYSSYSRLNVPNASLFNNLPDACTTLRVYLYNSYFKIKTILAAQCTGNSLPLKIYKDNVNANDAWKGVFDTVIQPSALRTLPLTKDQNVNNVSYCTDNLDRIFLDFSIYGTDAQAIRIIAET